MNERIRELAVQADPGYTGNSKDDMGTSLVGNDAIKKFVELIVRECAGVAEVSMSINSHPDDRLTVKNSVLKHFGVEE